ncbi:hypothetical protein GRI69_07570 [Erythrobacter vulgaris]|uniref:Uncharacterized protein n=1 Tax=Qipengyuania vulgaris TaxID=291985 RepID=A0A844XSX5_9SPHN|nr:hypothetical protein [Qipengyuania vulgaris]MXO48112.1 hypothetical protein [Qipengyuania vulgaris]
MKLSVILAAASLTALLSGPSLAQQEDSSSSPPPQEPTALATSQHNQNANSSIDPETRKNWGALASLAGGYWLWKIDGTEGSLLLEYSWKEPGRVLEVRQEGVASTWELKSNGKLVLRDANGNDTKEKWIVAADGTVSRKKKGYGGDFILRLQPAGADRVTFTVQKEKNALNPPTRGSYVRLNEEEVALAKAERMRIVDGVFDREDGASYVVLAQEGDTLLAKGPSMSFPFKREQGAEYRLGSPSNDLVMVYRIVDPTTVELFEEGNEKASLVRFTRRHGTNAQPTELAPGVYGRPGTSPAQANSYTLSGGVLAQAASYGVQHYRQGADGFFRSELYDGVVRVVDPYTIEFIPRNAGTPPHKIVRLANSSPTAFADAQRAEDEAERQWRIEEARMAAEDAQLARLEEQYEADNPPEVTTNNMGGFVGGLLKGWSEATAKNDAMEQSMRDSANEAIARGRAEYARRQAEEARREDTRLAAIERAQDAREQQAAFARQEQARLNSAPQIGAAANTPQPRASAGGTISQSSGLASKSVRVWLAVGMEATDRNTINPSCYSNTFTVDVEWDPKGWGNHGRVADAVAPLKSAFIAKCSQHGKPTSSSPNTWAEGLQDGFATKPQHAQHFYVNM